MTVGKHILTIAATLLACGAAAVAAPAAGATSFASHVQINSGATYVNFGIFASFNSISGACSGVAYSGVWISDSSGTRVSADAYCSSPGCTASESWTGTLPSGYPSLHNHGNATTSYFDGTYT